MTAIAEEKYNLLQDEEEDKTEKLNMTELKEQYKKLTEKIAAS